MQWETSRTNFDRNLGVVIGINSYKSNGIHDLKTAVDDAKAIADLLEKDYAYKKTDIIRLFDDQATLTGLKDLLDHTIPNQLKPTCGDRLIFYYAGHGIPRNSKDGPAGYLVPQDADLNNADSFLAMQYVYEQLSQLACHHLLVILDCCFAGTFQWVGTRKLIPILETVRREHYDRFIRFPAWQVITSSAHDQEAMDVALDNVVLSADNRGTVTNSAHSPFALALIEGLQNNRADLIADNVVTAHELYLYLEQRVSELSKQRQNPGLYPLRREYDRGEFIFTKPGFTSDQLKPAPPLDENNNPYRGLKPFDEKHAQFFFGRQVLIEEVVKRLLVSNQSLLVVLGVSGSGKSSLVKAGLIPYLRDKQPKQWYILEPMRPGELPFTSLARILLSVVNASLLEQLAQVSFLDEALKQLLESRAEADGDLSTADQAKSENETLIKVAQSWCSATKETKLLLVEDYLAQLKTLCLPEQQQLLVHLYEEILTTLNSLVGYLQQDSEYLITAIQAWSQNHADSKLLLVIDQFEELITASHEVQTDSQKSDETQGYRATQTQQSQLFLLMLQRAIAACPGLWRVVVTLRSDFEPRFLDSPLKSYWKDARFPVRAMNSDELRDAIEGPALKQALYFEPPELVGKLIDEVGQMPGALPLLSFTLSELYIKLHGRWVKDNASDRALRIKDYEELGGVAGALTRRATQEYDNLVREFGEESGKAYQATMRRLMLRMVTIDGGGVARRRVPESELVYSYPQENERVGLVSDRLVKARLLVKGQETGEPYIEPAHDFLIRGWDKLQTWIQEKQEDILLQQRLTLAANEWANTQQAEGYLWNINPRLDLLQEVIQLSENNWLNQLEMKFVKCSIRKRDEEFIKAETQNIQILVRSATSLLASHQQLEALIEAVKAGKKVKQLQNKYSFWSDSKLYSQVRETLQKMVYGVKERNRLEVPQAIIKGMSFNPAGQLLIATETEDGSLYLLNLTGKKLQQFPKQKYQIGRVYFSPDSSKIAVNCENTVCLWNLADNKLNEFPHQGSINNVSFSSDGTKLATAAFDDDSYQEETVRLWNLETNELEQLLTLKEIIIIAGLHFNSQGQLLIATLVDHGDPADAYDYRLHLLDLSGQELAVCPKSYQTAALEVNFSPDSERVVISFGEESFNADLWNLQNGHVQEEEDYLENDYSEDVNLEENYLENLENGDLENDYSEDINLEEDDLENLENGDSENDYSGDVNIEDLSDPRLGKPRIFSFSCDGKLLAIGYDDTIRLLALHSESWGFYKEDLTELRLPRRGIRDIKFSVDGKQLVTEGEDNVVRLWSLEDQHFCAYSLSEESLKSISFSPDGQIVATVDLEGMVSLLDLQGKLLQKFAGLAKIASVYFSPDGQKIGAIGEDGIIRLLNFQGNLLKEFAAHPNTVKSLSFSPDGQRIATIGDGDIFNLLNSDNNNTMVRLWNLDGLKLDESPSEADFTRRIESVSFSFDGKPIVVNVGEYDQDFGTVFLSGLAGNNSTAIIRRNLGVGAFNAIAFSHDASLLATAKNNKLSLWKWDFLKGDKLMEFTAHESEIKSISFSFDNSILALIDENGNAKLCWFGLDEMLSQACNILNSYLTHNPNISESDRNLCNGF